MIDIKHYAVKELQFADYNPRRISEKQFEGLKQSIKKFGFVEPVVVNTKTGNVVGGHMRSRAAMALGLIKIPVVEVNISLAKEKALNVSLNNKHISGDFDDTLEELLHGIHSDFDAQFIKDLNLDELLDISVDNENINEKEIDENLETKSECPSCGYKW